MNEKPIGSGIDDFLKEEGIFKEAEAQAINEVEAWQLAKTIAAANEEQKQIPTG